MTPPASRVFLAALVSAAVVAATVRKAICHNA